MKITMKEVAQLAGVGVGTVSRVLNNGSVKDSTRKRVERAIAELNYQPDIYARGLKTNRSNTVALILPSVWHPFFSELAFHVESHLEKNNYKLYLCNSNGNSAKEREYLQMVKQNKVDGIIGITYSDIDEYVSSNLPFVSIDRYFTEDVNYVTADNAAGGRLAVDELLKHGCKELAYIGGYQDTPNETKNRRKYFEISCKSKNITCHILDMLEPLTNVSEKVCELLTNYPGIDGIFTINDSIALDVVEILKTMGKRVPDDIQVIGFDGQRTSEGSNYLVSTIAQPIELMAQEAVDVLLKVINGKEVSKRTVLPVTFKKGGTTIEV
ncbi:LacI family DNA-binding transcriptional regulator [Enterococcus italicus]|uniref:Transcriptional regulator, LacI family n=1 Tax=Enterococcus italicus (strain DSM 15952 / CCUG 50447 / LMG 22039 / TP 1.5) TaxID=888064 RepID=E6LI21_ENTI1|nr:LacI family DNA-binding transcriptional regulator [Enterococcus italicus]EFU73187.1 transcriptional regulator, LacI family [Enterococcus italicus DSM 15952]OJG60197.1 LacI family transcription regulator [Enterococcus italicus DSM 15952]